MGPRFASLPLLSRGYLFSLWSLVAAALAVVLLRDPPTSASWSGVAIFAGAIALGHLVETPGREHSYVLSGPFVLAAALVLPPSQAVAAIGVGLLPGEMRSPSPWFKKAFNYALYLGGGLLAVAVFRVGAPTGSLLDPWAVPAGLMAALAFTLTNLSAIALAVRLAYGRPMRLVLTPTALVANLAIDGSGLAMAALWQASPLLLIFGAIPLVGGAYALLSLHLEEELRLDSKTGVYNARYATDMLHRLVKEHDDRDPPLSIIMADLDNLRDLNNRHGHLMGDHALQAFATILKHEAPADAYVARFGGEEFLVILPGQDAEASKLIAERARQRIRMARVTHEHVAGEASITVSFGVAALSAADRDSAELVHRADLALYQAKHMGRDRVAVALARPAPVRHVPVLAAGIEA